MNKAVAGLLVLVGFAFPFGLAQNLYLGAELGQLATSSSSDLSSRNLGAQVGLNLGGLGLRAAAEGNIAARSLESGSVDALLNLPVLGESALYLGAGADIFDLSSLGDVSALQTGEALQASNLGAHAVAGAEVRLGWFGVFGEIQPVYRLEPDYSLGDDYYLRTRMGLNLHF